MNPMLASRWLSAVLLAGSFARPVVGAGQSIPDLLLTRPERTAFRETSSYGEVMALAETLAGMADDVHFTTFGYTNEGRALPLVVVGAPAGTPEAVLATGKTRIYLQGDIHGGEVCGKEALLILLRDLVTGPRPPWADDLVLLIAPIYNADGNERVALRNRPFQHGPVGGMGQRANAQGLDLNRDHMKLDSPEARSLVALMGAYDPHVVVDLHTTNGSFHGYHLTYSPPLHPNTPPQITTFLREGWLPEVTRSVREDHGWEFYYYGNTEGPTAGWYTFDHRPRFNNNYVGLRNRMASLSEAYAYATFEERVSATLWFTEAVLEFAGEHSAEIERITAEADAGSVVGRSLTTRAEFERSDEAVEILLGEVVEERNPYSGEPMFRRTDVRTPTPMYEYGTFAPTETAVAPTAYYVLPSAEDAIERLQAHGVAVEFLASARESRVERFRLDSTAVALRPFQGRVERTVWGAWVPAVETLPAGTAYVPLEQPLGRLAFSLLEPRSDDGLVDWAIVDADIEAGTVPILRVPAPR
jgi:hypothetical protein